jgi:N-acetylmuramoyl-L-alanine amidase
MPTLEKPTKKPSSKNTVKSRGRICLDPGHGGADPGAVGGAGLTEAAWVLKLTKLVKGELENRNFEVLVTRDKDIEVDLEPRCRVSNEAQADLFVSLHVNAALNPSATGFEVYHARGSRAGLRFAKSVEKNLVEGGSWPLVSRGVKEAGFYVLLYTDCPAILVEACFITNPTDVAKVLNSEGATKALVGAIVEGIEEQFGAS